jgi:hypothetical protein
MIGLIVSGITAIPLETELRLLHRMLESGGTETQLTGWIGRIYGALQETNMKFPFMSYGTDWLAFAHVMIAIAFIGPLRDPVKNIWVIEFGLIACLCVFPFAFIAGAFREIPLYWRLIDCSFGLFGGLILWKCYRLIKKLASAPAMIA